jgi:hypothetical protein
LRKKLGSKANEILVPKKLSQALRYFENNIKPSFNPLDKNYDTESGFDIPMPSPDNPALGLEDGFLKLTTYTFLPSRVLRVSGKTFEASSSLSSIEFMN